MKQIKVMFSNWLNAAVQYLVRVFVATLGLFVSILPRPLELRLSFFVGRTLMPFFSSRRKIAEDNLKNCFPDLAPTQIDQMLKKNFEHYGALLFELLHMASPLRGHYARYAAKNSTIENLDILQTALDQKKGVIFVTSHMANWELMAASGGVNKIPLLMVTKRLKPAWFHKLIEDARSSLGVRGTYEPRTLPDIMRTLRRGQTVGIVMDQYAGPPMGIEVPFFGVRVGTLAAVSVLVERTGAIVLPVMTVRGGDGVVRSYVQPPPDLSGVINDNEACTALLAACVESWIRKNPTQWHWVHRRFKNVIWPGRA